MQLSKKDGFGIGFPPTYSFYKNNKHLRHNKVLYSYENQCSLWIEEQAALNNRNDLFLVSGIKH